MLNPTVRTISPEDHLAFLRSQRSASFLQTPAWGRVKSEWRHESIGWYAGPDSTELVGAGLVLYRQLPKVKRYLAYLPEGPVLDWSTDRLDAWLAPMARHLKQKTAYEIGVRLVGSEMCIRDSCCLRCSVIGLSQASSRSVDQSRTCLLYTSDAADE